MDDRWTPLLALLLLVCCDDTTAADPPDASCEGACFETLDAGPPPGQTLAPDAGPDSSADSREHTPCDPTPAPEVPPGLAGLAPRLQLAAGGPPSADQLVLADLDGDPDATDELVVVRGGRVEAYDSDGRIRWRSEGFGATALLGAADLDGDGRREVVAISVRDARVLDALTGAVSWRLPERLFGPETDPLVRIRHALLTDLEGDGLPDLYVADGGCSQAGRGHGAVVRFAGDLAGAGPQTIIAGPRANGRCARWQTVSDVDGDGAPDVLVTDAQGINAFDPLTGARRLCGDLPGTPASGKLPHRATPDGLLVVDRGRVLWVAPTDGPSERCEEGRLLGARWVVDLGGPVQPAGTHTADLDGDGIPDGLTSFWTGAAWRTVGLSGVDGARLLEIEDARLLGAFADGLLLRRGDGRAPARLGRVERWVDGAVAWGMDRADVVTRPPPPTVTGRTREFADPVTSGGRVALVAGRTDRVDELRLVDVGGDASSLSLNGPVGAVLPATDGLVVATADGGLALLDQTLSLQNADPEGRPAARAPSGAPTFAHGAGSDGSLLFAWTASGVLRALDLRLDGAERWRVDVGGPMRPGARPLVSGAGVVVVKDARGGPSAWSGLDPATGSVVWRYTADPTQVTALRDPVSVGGLAVLYGRGEANAVPAPDPRCPEDTTNAADLAAPDPDCPERPVFVRVLIGLDATTGACRWRSLLRPNTACGGPSNQVASVADGALYITESNAVRRIATDDGTVEATADNGRYPEGAPIGGGWIRATGGTPPLVRVGGNGPPDALDADLRRVWRADEPEQRAQTWVVRDAAALGEALWMSPGRGLPLHRYALADGALVATLGLRDGARVDDAETADPLSLERVTDGDAELALVSADDARLYALQPDGALAWTRSLPAGIGQADVVDADADGADVLVIALTDGGVFVFDAPAIAAPEAAWDLPCPAVAGCAPGAEIDETPRTDALCAEWVPGEGADGYEVRVVGRFGAVVLDWTEVGAGGAARLDELRLVPGLTYRIQVRAWRASGDRLERSAGTSTDGVEVVNDPAPEVSLTVSPMVVAPGGGPGVVLVEASDDDLLAGWQLEVLDGEDVVRTLARSALAHRHFEARREWDGRDDAGRAAAPGAYEVRARFTDRARNTEVVGVAVCVEACQ